MDKLEKKCEHCGATYMISDGYCRNCWKRLANEPSPKEQLLDGIKKADWHFFIDKNPSRYVDIYSKNEGKKIFVSWNWRHFSLVLTGFAIVKCIKMQYCFTFYIQS